MVGHDVTIISERFVTEGALATLGGNLPVEEFSHFTVGAEFPVSPGVMRVFNAPYAHLALASFSRNCLSAAAEERSVKWTQLIAAESHGFSPNLDLVQWWEGTGRKRNRLHQQPVTFEKPFSRRSDAQPVGSVTVPLRCQDPCPDLHRLSSQSKCLGNT